MIVETLTRLGVDRAIVVAHSWAGALASAHGARSSDRVGAWCCWRRSPIPRRRRRRPL